MHDFITFKGLNSHQKRLGNVNAQTQVMFHFCPASTERLAELGKSNPGWPLRFPFQIQITYTPAENPTQERMRVISTDLPVTDSPEQVFPETNLALMSTFAALSTANLARDGEFGAARHLGAAYRDLLSIAMQYQQGDDDGGGKHTHTNTRTHAKDQIYIYKPTHFLFLTLLFLRHCGCALDIHVLIRTTRLC